MKRQNRLLLLLLASALLLTACGLGPRSEPYTLSVWYVDGDPLAEPLAALAESCRGSRELGTLALLLRPFADQEALTRTLESGLVPDLLLGSHELAFSLYDRGLLVDVGGVSPRYPVWLSHRSDCIGHGFYPIGFSLPLLASRDRQSPESLWADAAAYGRWNALPFLCVQSFAPLFYQSLLDQGQEFSADPVKDSLNRNYVNFYNAVAEASFLRGLSTDLELNLPCRIESSLRLASRDLTGLSLAPLSEGNLLAEGYGLIVTAREPRSLRNLPAFLRWFCEGERLGGFALDCGLLPAVDDPLSTETPLQALLLSLRSRTLHLPDWNSSYVRNRSAFESAFRDSLELLH